MSEKWRLAGAAVVVLGAVAYLAGTLQDGGAVSGRPRQAQLIQGYPPPVPTASETPTPDSGGLLPAPDCVTTTVVSLGESPYSDMLVPLQTAFDQADGGAIATWIDPAYLSIDVLDVALMDSEGGGHLDEPAASALLAELFAAGSSPTVQGYYQGRHDDGDYWVEVAVLSHGWGGPVAFPTAEPVTPDYGAGRPDYIDTDAMIFEFVKNSFGSWRWERWLYGDYYGMAERYCGGEPWMADGYFLRRP